MNAPPQQSWTAGRIALLLGRIALAVVFLFAAYAKLDNPPGTLATLKLARYQLALDFFAISVNSYKALPDWAVRPVAYTLIPFEIFLGLCLLAGAGVRWSATAASALLAVFFTLMVRAYAKGMEIDCGCFGQGEAISPRTLARDAGLLLLALLVMFLAFRQKRNPDVKDVREVEEVKERLAT